jgi:hypothetical protein
MTLILRFIIWKQVPDSPKEIERVLVGENLPVARGY